MKMFKLLLAISFSATTIFGCSESPQGQKGEVRNIDQQEFATVLEDEKAIIVDVRTPEEVSAGYITGTNIFADINGSDFESKISSLDPSKAYIVYCRSGSRSSSAANYMVSKGFKKVYNLEGGISSWKGDVTQP